MKTFEEFKASREKMDPSTRKMSEHQWGQAYSAYRSAREHVRSSRASSSPSTKPRRRSSSASGMHAPSSASPSSVLKLQVRAESAYADLRLIVDILSWVILGATVLAAVFEGLSYTAPMATGVVLLEGAIQAIAIIVLRLVAHVVIDIPDVALYRTCRGQHTAAEDDEPK